MGPLLASRKLIAIAELACELGKGDREPDYAVAPTDKGGLLAPALDHLQYRPSRAALRLRITYQRGQRQAEDQLIKFVDMHSQLICYVEARHAILPQRGEYLLEDL